MGYFVFFCIFIVVIFLINRSLPDSVKKNATYEDPQHKYYKDEYGVFDPRMADGSGDNIYDDNFK